jgi:hypothetical protein
LRQLIDPRNSYFVAANGLLATVSYLVIVAEIRRMVLVR